MAEIGFLKETEKQEVEKQVYRVNREAPRRSVVQVFFPERGKSYAYYNDRFNLKVGDLVFVEGKLEGYRGQVTEVAYAFKIKLSDYKRVVARVDTEVSGTLYFSDFYAVAFQKDVIPFEKMVTWFKAPEEPEDFACGDDDEGFLLEEMESMHWDYNAVSMGRQYYLAEQVCYLSLDGKNGRAIVRGSKFYEVEFSYENGKISNVKCSCFCAGMCRHAYAALLQLKKTLENITKTYKLEFGGYFAAVDKELFISTVIRKKETGKMTLGD